MKPIYKIILAIVALTLIATVLVVHFVRGKESTNQPQNETTASKQETTSVLEPENTTAVAAPSDPTAPKVTIPEYTFPEDTVPDESLPDGTVPETTAPEITAPTFSWSDGIVLPDYDLEGV